jgi:hypothetical protein
VLTVCSNASRTVRYYLGAAFAIHDGRLLCSMDPKRFGPQPSIAYEGEMSDIPELTDEQLHALQRVSKVAHEHELRLNMRAGDLLFFNNLALLHRRDAYTDGDETSRHMVRLWLRNTRLGWSIPESMLPPWLAAYGEVQNVTERSYPLEADIKYRVPRYAAGSAAFILE